MRTILILRLFAVKGRTVSTSYKGLLKNIRWDLIVPRVLCIVKVEKEISLNRSDLRSFIKARA